MLFNRKWRTPKTYYLIDARRVAGGKSGNGPDKLLKLKSKELPRKSSSQLALANDFNFGKASWILFWEKFSTTKFKNKCQNHLGIESEILLLERSRNSSSLWLLSHIGKCGPIMQDEAIKTDSWKGGTQFKLKLKEIIRLWPYISWW